MKGMVLFVLGTGLVISASAESPPVKRDPFWPIGYDPVKAAVQRMPETTESAPKETKPEAPVLTDDQLRQLAQDEAERIRQELQRKGTMIAGDRIFAYLQNKWVAKGDTLTVEVEGNTYRLEILNLTSDNIELEAHPTAK